MVDDLQIKKNETAIIVIDMQNDYVHRDGAAIRYFREQHGSEAGRDGPTLAELIVPALRHLIMAARTEEVLVVWVKTLQTKWTESPFWQTRWKDLPGHDPVWGLSLFEGLAPSAEEPVVIKHRHSCFFNTDMDMILRKAGIRTLLMTGVGTPFCVEGSVRDAHALDYQVIAVSDATATRELEEHLAALRRIETAFGHVRDVESILSIWL
jgi:ureidoacrylate peracid hydrolase